MATSPRHAPGPRGLGPSGSALAWGRDPLRFLVEVQRRYGDVASFRLGRERIYLLSHADGVKHVLVDRAGNYPKPRRPPSPLAGNGLFSSEGDFWKKQRALIQPAFHRERVTAFTEKIVARTAALLDAWAPLAAAGTPFDVAEAMTHLAWAIMGTLVYGEEPGADVYAATRRLVYLLGHPEPALHRLLPFLASRRAGMAAAAGVLDALTYAELARRRREGPRGGDLLDMLLALRDRDTGEGMSDAQVRDEAMNLFAAGYEATGAALGWAWRLLDAHPEVERRLREEVTAVLDGRAPTAADLPRLRYTTQVFEESMRLYAPAWLLDRQAREDDVIAGYSIPAGTVVLMLPFIIHRNPALWEEPERFDPEHFSPERAARRSRFAFIPFGAGQRLCLGNNLAMLKGPLILAMVAQRYRLRVRRPAPPRLDAAITLTQGGGLEVLAEPLAAPPRALSSAG